LAGAGAWACALFLLALPHLGLATTRVLDFEGYAEGHILESDGDFEGITFQISDTEHYPRALVIFDSDCTLASGADPCTGGDYDLATPGAGPGNDRPQGNILILPRNVVDGDGDGNVDDPDDSTQGGDVTFSFDPWVKVRSITLIDIEEPDTEVRVVDAAGIERTFRPAHFGALGNNNAIRIDLCSAPSSGGGDCDGRIITMKFEYTGEGCSGTTNGQGGKVSCSGGATGVEPVAIRVTDRREEDVFANVAGVSIGDVFEVLAAVGGVSRLPPEIKVWIDDELEVIRIHTSCSRPLNVGDHFGSLRVVEMTTTEGGTVTIDDPNAPCPTARKLEIELDGSGGFDEIVYEDSCGDGDVDAGEECDDANPTTGDGCTPGCRAEECGDGTLQPTLGEECDDGNTTPSDGCSPNCLIEACLDDPDCDDGVFCNGFESCDLQTFKCISGVEPCGGATPLCDESGGTCVECLLETDCDDLLFCTGIEICAAGTCTDGTSPCIGLTPHCIELGSLCVECLDTQDCDDGLFCNGPETCSPAHMCLPGEKPCESGTPFCEEPSICRGCLNDDECQDGLACNGTETCDTQSGVCVAGASPCSGTTPICDEPGICRPCQSDGECQDDAFCNGAEQCSGTGACTLGLPPCWNPTPACDEGTDTCTPCVSDDECTDGQYCNGPEICTETGTCAPGTPPCTSPEPICDEDNAVCVGCLDDTHCDDGKFCTGPESCDLGTNTCVFSGSPCTAPLLCYEAQTSCVECISDLDCDDALYCNGVETCDPGTSTCTGSSGDPCGGTEPVCDESQDRCVGCLSDGNCLDALFCNGAETCDPTTLTCDPGADPCPVGFTCQEAGQICEGECQVDADCDDQLFCTGVEHCSGALCQDGTTPCSGTEPVCVESTDSCVECLFDSHCDDSVACNGFERCSPVTQTCTPGVAPDCALFGDACNQGECVEPSGACELVPEPFGTQCSDGDTCTAGDRCVDGACTGIIPPLDRDCDGFADSIEEAAGCDADDFYVIPTMAIRYSGSRLLKNAAEGMVTWFCPEQRKVHRETDPACDVAGRCAANGFCDRGRVMDPCTVDADCSLPENTCRTVANFGNVADMSYRFVRRRRDDVEHLFPIRAGCALKVDLVIPDPGWRQYRVPLRVIITGTTDKRLRRDRDVILFLRGVLK
jgi:cysteine-rich repeat protein